jgi:hypothetical protein
MLIDTRKTSADTGRNIEMRRATVSGRASPSRNEFERGDQHAELR